MGSPAPSKQLRRGGLSVLPRPSWRATWPTAGPAAWDVARDPPKKTASHSENSWCFVSFWPKTPKKRGRKEVWSGKRWENLGLRSRHRIGVVLFGFERRETFRCCVMCCLLGGFGFDLMTNGDVQLVILSLPEGSLGRTALLLLQVRLGDNLLIRF